MRYLIDCTFVYQHPTHNFGIQRVVRNVFHQLQSIEAGDDELLPVIVLDDHVYAIDSLPDKVSLMTPAALKLAVHESVVSLDRKRERWGNTAFIQNNTWASKALSLVHQLMILPLRIAFKLARLWEVFWGKRKHSKRLDVGQGDTMLLLDSSWQYNFEPMLRRGKANGMQVIAVVYDLIPVTHPQFCVQNLVKHFKRWLGEISETADGYIAISKTIRDELYEFQLSTTALPVEAFQYFYLGAELKLPATGLPIRQDFLSHGDARMYLTVGTLEPRKNHRYLLDAFDLLWAQGEDVHLYIVGKIGWKCDELVDRIESHAEFGKRLHFYGDANDAELLACYKAATAVVFSSHVEGFGLPLIEAWQQGTQVYVSDIPVFRELGGENTHYFDLQNPESLAEIIRDEKEVIAPIDGEWLSWQQSAQRLYDAAKAITNLR